MCLRDTSASARPRTRTSISCSRLLRKDRADRDETAVPPHFEFQLLAGLPLLQGFVKVMEVLLV
jgi:hypothetical protein